MEQQSALTERERLAELVVRLGNLQGKHERLERRLAAFHLLLVESQGHFAHTCNTGPADRCVGCSLERRIADALVVRA